MRTEQWFNDYVFTVEEFLTAQECDDYIQMSEDVGYEDALVTVGESGNSINPQTKGQQLRTDVRNNQRVVFMNDAIAKFLWERALDFVPMEHEGRSAIGCNEMLRFYRYDPGQQFDWHQDFPYERDNGEKSFWTLMIYLNEGFQGGATSFEDSYSLESFDPLEITPKRGMALFFDHSVHHKGEPVQQGRKYVLRTDVMYSSDDPDSENAEDNDDDDEHESDDPYDTWENDYE